MNASPKDPPIQLKNPVAAAILAFLVPGAGHFYQGRIFKGIIYFVCILTLFIWGMQIGHWGILYRLEPQNKYQSDNLWSDTRFDPIRQRPELKGPSRADAKTHWGYFAQVPVGLFSIPAFIQEERYYSNTNAPSTPESFQIAEPVQAEFAYVDNETGFQTLSLTGVLELAPEQSDFGRIVKGTFRGQSDDGKETVIDLGGGTLLDAPIATTRERLLRVAASRLNDEEIRDGVLVAIIPRSPVNWFLVPPDFANLERLHSQLGKKYTLAEVFTWIAGLLNVLAIWDAFAGPAYGYRLPVRSEVEDDTEQKSGDDSESEREPVAASAGTA